MKSNDKRVLQMDCMTDGRSTLTSSRSRNVGRELQNEHPTTDKMELKSQMLSDDIFF